MATTRDLAALLSARLGMDVVPIAARLVRASILPQRYEDVDSHEAAYLLLAAMAAPTSGDAALALDTVSCLPLSSVWSRQYASADLIGPSLKVWMFFTPTENVP